MSEKDQFDCLLGGLEVLPSEISYFRYAAARSKEIEFLKKSIRASKGSKLIFQKLPKHMRRRAMSHNAKRLPRRLRQIHLNQLEKSGLPQKQKKSCRKFKRRPNNLVEEYARRQKKHIWLNTHIWHAKRFHMTEKWGFRLPLKPCDKAFRACFRATTKYCLLQDISYYSCIEISGNYEFIIDEFSRITNKDFGYTIAARPFILGHKEGCVNLVNIDNPLETIGQVYFSWRPYHCLDSEGHRCLWLWVHAAFYQEVLNTLLKLFILKPLPIDRGSTGCQQYINDLLKVRLSELKTELNRFRLTGPQANAVVQNCFKYKHFPSSASCSENATWYQDYQDNAEKHQISVAQCCSWSCLKNNSVYDLAPYTILSLISEDPRFNLPKKRTNSVTDNTNYCNLDLSPEVCFSELWDEKIRNLVNESKLSNAKICEIRSQYLVPGGDVDDNLKTPVPVMFVQRPGCKFNNIGYGGGWDIILPASWAQPIWTSLIMWGARAGGLRETSSISFEMGQQPFLMPDTAAGKKEEREMIKTHRDMYFKKPPNRRPNYNKFSIFHPFEWNWKMLIRDWSDSTESVTEFSVLRNKKILNVLQIAFANGKLDIEPQLLRQNYLIPVHLKSLSKGIPMAFGLICLPHHEDYKKTPVEPFKRDPNEQQRKQLRKSHKALLKKLRQRRVRAKKLNKVLPIDRDMLQEYTSKMRKLWLPEPTKLRHSCSRQVIGLVQQGDFSFSLAQGSAIGYIAIGALPHLFKLKERKVLFRNNNTRQYRLASINVVCE